MSTPLATRKPGNHQTPRLASPSGLVVLLALLVAVPLTASPPFAGTAFLHPSILVESDATAFEAVEYAGRGIRTMFDRREGTGDDSQGAGDWITRNAYLFDADYGDGFSIEVQVNPEFGGVAAAEREADYYARVIGRLPAALRTRVETTWIHKGDFRWGGGNENILIHVGKTAEYLASGALEEVLMHEAVHTSLDPDYRAAPGWKAAQAADDEFISVYARDYPETEDLAESFVPFVAVEYRTDRIPAKMAKTIRETIPNRIAYFKSLNLDMWPLTPDNPPAPPDPGPTSGCRPTTTALQFDGGYRVSMCYRTPQGEEGQARSGIWASGQAGLLWFFDRGNAEALVKVLDGCAHNGHRWVFVAPVTDLEFNLWVTGPNGERWTHSNQQGVTASTKSDTSAFRCS